VTGPKVRIGMISFAHMHAHSYAWAVKGIHDAELVGITDSDAGRGAEQAAIFGTRFIPRRADLLGLKPDAVIVCSENVNHAADVVAAAEAGAHVMCEKPLATNPRAARAMIDGCRRAGVNLMTAFPVRFSPPVIRAKQAVDGGEIGRLLAAKTTNHGSMPGGWFTNPRLSGGGAVIDHTVHVVDALRWFLGDEVSEVYAEIGKLIYPRLKCDDCGLLSLKFRRGFIATLDSSWSRVQGYPTWGDVTMYLWGERGAISVDAFSQQVTVYGKRAWFAGWGDSPDMGLVHEFVASVRDQRPPAVTGEDGMRAMEVALAAYESARRGKPVKLALRP